ncbi:MAG TPA: hypothetical protein VHJ20_01170 [Polyangia bacterium]|nr:hypothetical protein [Polyangia bacterium]
MRRRVRIQPYVPRDLQQKLRSWAAAQNLTESAVTEAALSAYLDDRRTDEDVVARRLDLVSQAVARLQSDVDVLADAFGGYVRRLFLVALTKAGPDQNRLAEEAYQTFLRGILDDSGVAGRFIGNVRRARARPIPPRPGAPPTGGR